MALWQKAANSDGWTAIRMGAASVSLVHVVRSRDAKPVVKACESFAREGTELDVLKRLRKAGHLGRNRCTTLLEHGRYQLLQVDRPDSLTSETPREEARDTLRWRIKEMVDFPVGEAGIDVLDIPVQAARSPQMWVVASSHAELRPRIQMFQAAKIPLEAIDIPELAQRNLASLYEEEMRGLALVAFDENGGRLTISYEGELYLTRHLEATSAELANPNAVTQHERVLLDIQRTLDNFDRNYSAIPVTRLMFGPLPNGDIFLEYLRSTLTVPVIAIDLADAFDFSAMPRLAEPAAQADHWLLLGAALRD